MFFYRRGVSKETMIKFEISVLNFALNENDTQREWKHFVPTKRIAFHSFFQYLDFPRTSKYFSIPTDLTPTTEPCERARVLLPPTTFAQSISIPVGKNNNNIINYFQESSPTTTGPRRLEVLPDDPSPTIAHAIKTIKYNVDLTTGIPTSEFVVILIKIGKPEIHILVVCNVKFIFDKALNISSSLHNNTIKFSLRRLNEVLSANDAKLILSLCIPSQVVAIIK